MASALRWGAKFTSGANHDKECTYSWPDPYTNGTTNVTVVNFDFIAGNGKPGGSRVVGGIVNNGDAVETLGPIPVNISHRLVNNMNQMTIAPAGNFEIANVVHLDFGQMGNYLKDIFDHGLPSDVAYYNRVHDIPFIQRPRIVAVTDYNGSSVFTGQDTPDFATVSPTRADGCLGALGMSLGEGCYIDGDYHDYNGHTSWDAGIAPLGHAFEMGILRILLDHKTLRSQFPNGSMQHMSGWWIAPGWFEDSRVGYPQNGFIRTAGVHIVDSHCPCLANGQLPFIFYTPLNMVDTPQIVDTVKYTISSAYCGYVEGSPMPGFRIRDSKAMTNIFIMPAVYDDWCAIDIIYPLNPIWEGEDRYGTHLALRPRIDYEFSRNSLTLRTRALLADIPLTQGDLRDHVSGAQLVNTTDGLQSFVDWNNTFNAYEFHNNTSSCPTELPYLLCREFSDITKECTFNRADRIRDRTLVIEYDMLISADRSQTFGDLVWMGMYPSPFDTPTYINHWHDWQGDESFPNIQPYTWYHCVNTYKVNGDGSCEAEYTIDGLLPPVAGNYSSHGWNIHGTWNFHSDLALIISGWKAPNGDGVCLKNIKVWIGAYPKDV